MITVLLDGRCIMCRHEIEFYNKGTPTGRFLWLVMMAPETYLQTLGVKRHAAFLPIHVFYDRDACLTGANACIAIWESLPGFRSLGWIISAPLIRPLARWIYSVLGLIRCRLHGYDKCEL